MRFRERITTSAREAHGWAALATSRKSSSNCSWRPASTDWGLATDLARANTGPRVVNQVLRWRGLTAEQIDAGWQDEDCDPEHDAVYAALVRMTHQKCRDGSFRPGERPGSALFEGGGNWGVPGDPECPPVLASLQLLPADCRGRAVGLVVVGAVPRVPQERRTRRCNRRRGHEMLWSSTAHSAAATAKLGRSGVHFGLIHRTTREASSPLDALCTLVALDSGTAT